jgi:hypothetical protein
VLQLQEQGLGATSFCTVHIDNNHIVSCTHGEYNEHSGDAVGVTVSNDTHCEAILLPIPAAKLLLLPAI